MRGTVVLGNNVSRQDMLIRGETIAQLGDLWESILKRYVHVKDAGNIIAGHGGVLDRFDSLVFSTPIFYFYISHFYK